MSMQEHIADEIEQAFADTVDVDTSYRQLAEAGAAAVRAALPDMIKPLEWETETDSGFILYSKGYTVSVGATKGKYYVSIHGTPLVDSIGDTVWHYTESAAISAANAHNVATIMGAFE